MEPNNKFFTPDEWSRVFLAGLQKEAKRWARKNIWEVGVGTGELVIKLQNLVEANWHISDKNPQCTTVAYNNILRAKCAPERLIPLFGEWDLVHPPTSGMFTPKVDVIFSCIPQVPSSNGLDLQKGDNMAHYYEPKDYPEATLNGLGLGTNEALLLRAKKVLFAKGEIILNLAGRPGLNNLEKMFVRAGYAPDLIHQEVVPQHAGTSLQSLARLEHETKMRFEFFSDPSAHNQISAREAENRRVAGRPIFHMLYVIKGVMM